MQRLAPVVWAKGTFLNPQHLQVQDRYLESMLQFKSSALHFAPWGFQRLELDQEVLAAGAITITDASGIMPEGLLFDVPRSDSGPAVRAFATNFESDSEPLTVYLGVPEYHDGGANISQHARAGHARYSAAAELVRDEFNDRSEKHVIVARKNFRVLFGGESHEGYSVMPVAQVERTPAGLYRVRPQFVPPLIEFRANGYLNSIGGRLLEILSGRSMELSSIRRQRNQTLADVTVSDIPSFWLLYTVNSFLPAFRHLIDLRGGHPEQLYALMLQLAGSLTAFSNRVQPADLPPYDHENLGGCFTLLDEKVRLLLDTVVPSHYVSLPLRSVARSVYATSIEKHDYFSNKGMYLALRADLPRAELLSRVPQLVKVASVDGVDHLVQRALPGIRLRHVPDPPSALPVQLDYVYYSVDQSGPEYDAIKKARNIAAYVPGEIENVQAELVIILDPAAKNES